MANRLFTQESFNFLTELAANNRRDWFGEHKERYETAVRTPALHFISEIAEQLPTLSPYFVALPKKVGGALMRIQRDTRFGHDKRPYKTNIGIQFRHEVGKDVHAPGYYLHIEPQGCFLGVGLWRPEPDALKKIREGILTHDQAWLSARDDAAFKRHFTLTGDALTNPPRGYPKEHPLIDDLKRKDFIAIANLKDKEILSKTLCTTVIDHFQQATPFMRFLCKTLELRF